MAAKVVEISRHRLSRTIRELARRGEGKRESGAFLLSRLSERPLGQGPWPVAHVVFYDDLDAECLTGGITFTAFEGLWSLCRELKMTVVADVHTHPGAWVAQSSTDADNPMISSIGHVAVIVPNYAQHSPRSADFGVHVHLGGKRWKSFHGAEGTAFVISSSFLAAWHAFQNRLGRKVTSWKS